MSSGISTPPWPADPKHIPNLQPLSNKPDIDGILGQLVLSCLPTNKWLEIGIDTTEAKQAIYSLLAAEAVTMRMVNVMNEDISLAQPAVPLSKLKAIMEIKEL